MKLKQIRLSPVEIAISLVSFAAVAALLWVYFYFTVPEEYYINKGPIREAKNNPYFAMQKYLEGEGVPSTILYNNAVLGNLQAGEEKIGPDDVLVLIQGRGVIHQKRFDVLWPWVEEGGKLMTSVVNPYFSDDHDEDVLFKTLGIEGGKWSFASHFNEELDEDYPFEEAGNEDNPFHLEHKKDEEGLDSGEPEMPPSYLELFSFRCYGADVYVENLGPGLISAGGIDESSESEKLAIQSGWGNYFDIVGDYEAKQIASFDEGYAFARFEIGKGSIVINGDNSIWSNRKIACQDHAYLLKRLVGEANHVWFLVNSEAPSFFNLVWKGIPLAVVAFALALILMLWRTLRRFGPLYPDTRIERRHFSEHIRAAASFLYRVGIEAELLENLRIQIARLMQRKNRNFDELDSQQQVKSLALHSKLSPKEIEFAYLSPLDNLSKKDFVLVVKTLKALKEQL